MAFGEVVLASTVINLLALATPLFMMTVYNKVISHGALHTLDVLAIGMLGLFVFEIVLRALRGYVASRLGARVDVALGLELVERTLALPLGELERLAGKGLADRLRQLDHLRAFFASQLPILLVDLAFVGLFVAALFVLSPLLAWITVGVMPGFILLSVLAAGRQTGLARTAGRFGAEKAACLGEAMGQALTVKALGLEGMVRRRYERRLLDSAWTSFKAGTLTGTIGSFAQALQHVAALAVIYIGAREIISGDLTIGALVAATILSGRSLAPMRQVVGAWQQLWQAREAWHELAAIAPPPRISQGDRDPGVLGDLALEEVTFRYAADRPPAVDAVSLSIPKGRMFALVGPPGSGKSTIVRLLLGLEAPQSGRVTLDGHDLQHLPEDLLRAQIGVVPQEVQLFAGTVAENVAAGSEEAGFARIVAAAKFVGLHDTVQALPEGYQTMLGDRGRGLSLGQRQLVAIARALVRNPRIIILDEATSALDAATEATLLKALKRVASGRTVLMVTHRRSVLEACDQAALMDNGRLVRIGAPAEIALLAPESASGGRSS
jgi:ABC-type bacteriocin/lantibiotic exporter with double-glycine peptidase domain